MNPPGTTIDLHIHSTYSDGLLSLQEIVDIAVTRNLAAIALTDHDTTAGVPEILRIGQAAGIEVVPGIEISVSYNGCEAHLLGYFIDPTRPILHHYAKLLNDFRVQRAKKIVRILKHHGMDIPFELVAHKANGSPIGRPHIAEVMMEEGYVFSMYEAFQKYLGEDKPADVPKMNISPGKGVEIIKEAGGLAFLAHPVTIPCCDDFIAHLLEMGLDGIETIHPKHTFQDRQHLRAMAQNLNLLESGGSDCHGGRHGTIQLGALDVPVAFVKRMKEKHEHLVSG